MTGPGGGSRLIFRDEDDRKSVVLDRVRLEFSWTGDRWAHAFGVGEGSPLVRTLEWGDDPDPARVVSPAYQQFHWHEEADGRGRAMLVGMSGPHHFSAVFAPESRDGGCELVVDVADRCRSVVDVLACTYLVERTSGDLRDADASRIVWSVEGGALALEAGPGTSLSLDEGGRRATRVQTLARIDRASQTQRCEYRWSWMPGLSGG